MDIQKIQNNAVQQIIDAFTQQLIEGNLRPGDQIPTEVELSDQFFSWLCGFGNKVKIMEPELAEKFTAYLDKIRSLY